MDFVIKGRTSVFIKKEVTEGSYQAPDSALDAIEVLEDFSGFEFTRESIERSVLSDTVESEAPRAGLPSVMGTLPTEFKASAVEGGAPRTDVLMESLLGGKRQSVSAITSTTGHTTTVINLDDLDVNKIKAGDSVHLKIAGAHKVRPVKSVNNTLGAASITLDVALDAALPDGTVIAPLTTYFFETNNSAFSVSAELGDEILEKGIGGKVESGEIGNWTTGQIPQITFAIKALELQKEVSGISLNPDFSTEPQPPVALDACAYINGVEVDYNEFKLSMKNSLSELMSACSGQGKIATRNTKLLVTGSINPYMSTDNVDWFDKFNASQAVSLFIHIGNPSTVAGEYKNISAIYMPQVVLTSVTNGDQDGVLTDELEFQAFKKNGNDTLFMSFI
jgi:hypothetical protein